MEGHQNKIICFNLVTNEYVHDSYEFPSPLQKKNTEKDMSATELDINIPATGLEKIASH